MRATIDANVWVSGFLSRHGAPSRVVAYFLAGRFTLVTSEPLLAEVADVLARPHIARRTRLGSRFLAELESVGD